MYRQFTSSIRMSYLIIELMLVLWSPSWHARSAYNAGARSAYNAVARSAYNAVGRSAYNAGTMF